MYQLVFCLFPSLPPNITCFLPLRSSLPSFHISLSHILLSFTCYLPPSTTSFFHIFIFPLFLLSLTHFFLLFLIFRFCFTRKKKERLNVYLIFSFSAAYKFQNQETDFRAFTVLALLLWNSLPVWQFNVSASKSGLFA